MIKVYIFNKSNSVSRFDIFKKFFECVNCKISLPNTRYFVGDALRGICDNI